MHDDERTARLDITTDRTDVVHAVRDVTMTALMLGVGLALALNDHGEAAATVFGGALTFVIPNARKARGALLALVVAAGISGCTAAQAEIATKLIVATTCGVCRKVQAAGMCPMPQVESSGGESASTTAPSPPPT